MQIVSPSATNKYILCINLLFCSSIKPMNLWTVFRYSVGVRAINYFLTDSQAAENFYRLETPRILLGEGGFYGTVTQSHRDCLCRTSYLDP